MSTILSGDDGDLHFFRQGYMHLTNASASVNLLVFLQDIIQQFVPVFLLFETIYRKVK
jgi:hypothetical protein